MLEMRKMHVSATRARRVLNTERGLDMCCLLDLPLQYIACYRFTSFPLPWLTLNAPLTDCRIFNGHIVVLDLFLLFLPLPPNSELRNSST